MNYERLDKIRERAGRSLTLRPNLRLTYRGGGTCLATSPESSETMGWYRFDAVRGLVLVEYGRTDSPIGILHLSPRESEQVADWMAADDGWEPR